MIELQRKLIGDKVRNDAFHAALKHVIDADSEVIDLGSGTVAITSDAPLDDADLSAAVDEAGYEIAS